MRGLGILVAIGAAMAAPAIAQPPTVKSGVEAWQAGDYAKATAIWQALAGKGDADAAFNLGQAYRLGRGVGANSGQAAAWFERAAKAGHLDAQVSLGLLLFDSGDRKRAMTWLMRAAERGEPRALLVTGTALFNGDGIERDAVKGYSFVSRAAAQGLQPAKATLAEMDKVIPLAQRQRGVAMALEAVKGKSGTKSGTIAAPKPKAEPTLADKAVKLETRAQAPAKAATNAPATVSQTGGWRIQLGAFSNRGGAQTLFGKLRGKLGGAQAYYVNAGAVTRLQVGPYPSRADANAACARLRPQACFPVAAN
jgi:TPR repeat protein